MKRGLPWLLCGAAADRAAATPLLPQVAARHVVWVWPQRPLLPSPAVQRRGATQPHPTPSGECLQCICRPQHEAALGGRLHSATSAAAIAEASAASNQSVRTLLRRVIENRLLSRLYPRFAEFLVPRLKDVAGARILDVASARQVWSCCVCMG